MKKNPKYYFIEHLQGPNAGIQTLFKKHKLFANKYEEVWNSKYDVAINFFPITPEFADKLAQRKERFIIHKYYTLKKLLLDHPEVI